MNSRLAFSFQPDFCFASSMRISPRATLSPQTDTAIESVNFTFETIDSSASSLSPPNTHCCSLNRKNRCGNCLMSLVKGSNALEISSYGPAAFVAACKMKALDAGHCTKKFEPLTKVVSLGCMLGTTSPVGRIFADHVPAGKPAGDSN